MNFYLSKTFFCCLLRSITKCYSEHSQISEVLYKVKLSESNYVNYEYYTSTTSNGELIQIRNSTQIKDLGEIEDSQVISWLQ